VREGALFPADDLAAAFAGVRRVAAPLPAESLRLMRSERGAGGGRYTTLLVVPLGDGQAGSVGNVAG
jgi:hypothetical protein